MLVKEEIRRYWAGQWEGEEQWVRQTRAELAELSFFFFSLNMCLCPLHSVFRTEYFGILDC